MFWKTKTKVTDIARYIEKINTKILTREEIDDITKDCISRNLLVNLLEGMTWDALPNIKFLLDSFYVKKPSIEVLPLTYASLNFPAFWVAQKYLKSEYPHEAFSVFLWEYNLFLKATILESLGLKDDPFNKLKNAEFNIKY